MDHNALNILNILTDLKAPIERRKEKGDRTNCVT